MPHSAVFGQKISLFIQQNPTQDSDLKFSASLTGSSQVAAASLVEVMCFFVNIFLLLWQLKFNLCWCCCWNSVCDDASALTWSWTDERQICLYTWFMHEETCCRGCHSNKKLDYWVVYIYLHLVSTLVVVENQSLLVVMPLLILKMLLPLLVLKINLHWCLHLFFDCWSIKAWCT